MFQPESLPEPLADVLTQVRQWSQPEADLTHSAQERASWLVGLRQLIDAAEAAFSEQLATFDANGEGEILHAAGSTAAWLRGALHLASGDAGGRVAIARGLRHHLQPSARGLTDGIVTFDQVRTIEHAIRRVPEAVRTEGAEFLTDLATRTDATRLRVAGRALLHTVDPDGALSQAQQQFDRRWLQLSPLLDGMTSIDGMLDAEAATVISTALAPFLVPAGPHDDRTSAQRRADGLVDVARAAMAADALPELSGAPTQVQVLLDTDWLTGVRSGSARLTESLAGTDFLTPPDADRLACDAAVARVLLGPDAVPLELGRSTRLFTPSQRRALAIRDGGCRFPDCPRPARYTDAHHVQSWARGGTTDLPNALLLCRYHHRSVHQGSWAIHLPDRRRGSNGPVVFVDPQGRQHPTHPRGP